MQIFFFNARPNMHVHFLLIPIYIFLTKCKVLKNLVFKPSRQTSVSLDLINLCSCSTQIGWNSYDKKIIIHTHYHVWSKHGLVTLTLISQGHAILTLHGMTIVTVDCSTIDLLCFESYLILRSTDCWFSSSPVL